MQPLGRLVEEVWIARLRGAHPLRDLLRSRRYSSRVLRMDTSEPALAPCGRGAGFPLAERGFFRVVHFRTRVDRFTAPPRERISPGGRFVGRCRPGLRREPAVSRYDDKSFFLLEELEE